jgi:uncharacterized protein
MKIAIIGAGIAGNVVARNLHRDHDITVYEAAGRVGGHAHTHTVERAGKSYRVDTGFIVYNERTYPHFISLLKELEVDSQESSMSFSVRNQASGLEYNGASLNTLFAQRRNLVRPSFLGMIRDILRFNRAARSLLGDEGDAQSLAEFLERGRYGRAFVDHYILPMGAAIWSTDRHAILNFPARFFLRFFHQHGLLSVNDRPLWRTVRGGSVRYVERLTAPFRERIRLKSAVECIRRGPGGVMIKPQGSEARLYDVAFVACHSDQALALLVDPSVAEREVLGAIRYQSNEAVLHTDTRLLPTTRRAWAAWNYHVLADDSGRVALTYNMNVLQRLDAPTPFLVTLNRCDAIDPSRVIQRVTYRHPLFTAASVAAQTRHRELNGYFGTYYCGAWWRYGFHEDGVASALAAIDHFKEDHAQRSVLRRA